MALSVVKADKFLPLCGTGPETPKLIEKKRQEKTYIFFLLYTNNFKGPILCYFFDKLPEVSEPRQGGSINASAEIPIK